MIRSILVPLDGSPFAEHALPVAASLARLAGAELRLVTVHEPAMPVVAPADVPVLVDTGASERMAQSRAYLESIADKIAPAVGGKVRSALLEGFAGQAIAEAVDREPPSLVVMCTHGRGPLSRFWLGSVADYLVRHVTVPVLLIRPTRDEDEPELSIRSILVPVDLSEHAEAVLGVADEVARLYGARITLFHVVVPPVGIVDGALPFPMPIPPELLKTQHQHAEQRMEQLAERLRGQGATVETALVIGVGAATAILERLADHSHDLVAMTTRGASGLRRMVVGSVADKVIRGATQPVLVVHPGGHP